MTRVLIALLVAVLPLAAADKTAAEHLAEAAAHLEASRLEAAAEAARAALALEPDNAEAHYLLGRGLQFTSAEHQPVEAAFKRAVELKPEEARYHFALGAFYRRISRPEPALASFQRAAALDGKSIEYARELAAVARLLKRWPEAEAAYRALSELEPGREVHFREAARAAVAQQRIAEAEPLYLAAVALLTDVTALQTLANEVAPHKLWGVCKAAGARVLDLQSQSAIGHYLLGVAYEQQGELAPAEMSYRRTALLAPYEALPWLHLGRVLRREQRWKESEAMVLAAIGRQPNLADAHNELGVLFSDQARLAEAIPHYTKAAELAPGNAQVLYNQGKTLVDLGRHAEAVPVLQRLLTITNGHAEVQKLLDQALAGQAQPPTPAAPAAPG